MDLQSDTLKQDLLFMAKQELKLKGKIEVELDQVRLEAFLKINKEEDADKLWSQQDVVNLIQQAGVTVFKLDELGKQLAGAESSREKSIRFLFASGQAPKAPQVEEFTLEDSPVPPEWKDPVSEALAHASPPHITKTVQQKVEVEKTVIKKGPLPFLPGKEETVKVVEKESHEETIPVDPAAEKFAYVKAGQKVGTIAPAKPGLPGKDFKGQMIAPPTVEDTVFHLGLNLSRKGTEITAVCSGIVRCGKNWVDLVPFAEHVWELSQSEDKATCFLDLTPGTPLLPPPSGKMILDKAHELGYKPEDLLPLETLDAEIADAVASGHALERKSLSESQDAFWDILISEDKLKAVLNAAKGTGHGKALVMKELGKSLNDSKIAFNKDRIKKEIPEWFNSNEKVLIGYVLQEGKPPVAPPAQKISVTIPFLDKKEADPLLKSLAEKGLPIDAASSFPMESIKGIAMVTKDQRPISIGPLGAGTPGLDVLGQAIPAPPAEPAKLKLYGELEIVGSTIVQCKAAGILVCAGDESNMYAAVFPHADAEVSIELADKNMSAWISGFGHKGIGKALSPEQVQEAVKKAGVTKGINQEILSKVTESLLRGEDVTRICFAQGVQPVSRGNSELKWLIHTASGKAVGTLADGRADFRNQDKITTVKKGMAIAELLPPTINGTPGFDVMGKDIPVPDSGEADISLGPGLKKETKPDGSVVVIADVDGELKQDKGFFTINPCLTIKGNIDTSVGNIKFPGTVQVSGDVMTGFAVLSGSDIKVAGSIEAALLSADGDILIQGGVKGAGKALLRTKKNVLVSFMELCTAMVVGELKVKKAIMRSKIKCNSVISMPDDGHIVGGEIKVKSGLVTGSIGNDKFISTRIFFGQDILVEDQISVEEKEIQKAQEELAKINTAMKSPDKINDKSKLQELFNQKFALMKALEKRNLRLFTLKERFEQHYDSKIIIKNTLWPGVILESHGRTHEVTKPSKNVMITFDTTTGRIIESPLDGKKG